MLTAGDEFGRTQRGNNNAYCQDSAITWLSGSTPRGRRICSAHVSRLIALRAENPALRPSRFAPVGSTSRTASVMDWFDQSGETMSSAQWTNPAHRTIQYVAASTPEHEAFNRILLMVHGNESPIDVHAAREIEDVTRYVSLWSAPTNAPSDAEETFAPGDIVPLPGTSMRLFRAE